MREIHVSKITESIKNLAIESNLCLTDDLVDCIHRCSKQEEDELPHSIFSDMLKNLDLAKKLSIPICQDTGMAIVFADIGQDVHISGGLFDDAVNEGIRQGYKEGYLRKSIVADPLRRINTGDNTPAVIHTRLVEGDRLSLTLMPKGFGSENMSRLCMLLPSSGEQDIIDFVVDVVRKAGGNPCPPVVLGVGIGGSFESCPLMAKRALCRNLDEKNPDEYYAALEQKILAEVNSLGIGPQGMGGKTTALAVNIAHAPTHIAGLPLAVNVGCHVSRHGRVEL